MLSKKAGNDRRSQPTSLSERGSSPPSSDQEANTQSREDSVYGFRDPPLYIVKLPTVLGRKRTQIPRDRKVPHLSISLSISY
jgi:hypothetical protein